jgi:hypothetical protein
MMKWGWAHNTQESIQILVAKREGKRVLWRPSHRWEDNIIKIDFQDRGCDDVDWIRLAQDRVQLRALQITVMAIRFTHEERNLTS